MHLVQKQDAAISLFHQPLAITIRPGIRAAHDTKEMSHQKLGIASIIGAVEAYKGRIQRQRAHLKRKTVHQARKSRLTDATRSAEQRM